MIRLASCVHETEPLVSAQTRFLCARDRAVGFCSEKGNWFCSVRYQMVLGSMSTSGAVFMEQLGGAAAPRYPCQC